MNYPRHDEPVPESALVGYLEEARVILAAAPGDPGDESPALSPDFEHLRWFELPAACLR
jgi:hypothetical protein